MVLSIDYFPVASTIEVPVSAPRNGIFISARLLGLVNTDLEESDSDKESKVIRAFLAKTTALFANGLAPLGITLTASLPIVVAANLINQTYVFSETRIAYLGSNILQPIPFATDSNNQRNPFSLQYYGENSNVQKLASGSAIPEPGIVISSNTLIAYGAPPHEELFLNGDGRSWLTAIVNHIVFDAGKRTSEIPSAVVATAKVGTSIFTPPPNFTTGINRLTEIGPEELPFVTFITSTYSVTVQIQLDSSIAPINNVSA